MTRRRGRRSPQSFLVLGALAIGLSMFGAPTAANASPTNVQAFMTLYGWADNSPPGPVIAHPCLHNVAGGVGTFSNPVTFATDVSELGWCQVIYVPYMKRYFIHEDECSECDADWARSHLYRFDMWAGGDANSKKSPEKKALRKCESTWTRADSISDPANPTIIVDPPGDLPVTTAPIFSGPTTCWTPIAVTNPGKQTTSLGTAVSLGVRATDASPTETLRYSATGLPGGLSINAVSGVISGRATARGKKHVTVKVTDSVDAAAISFIWNIKR
ncbi:MAG TPA: Ig domain-containing protein [Acidimicrobiales bacterium]|nr:Ig domain-containing protein [Acidimicrobiales bacterium]